MPRIFLYINRLRFYLILFIISGLLYQCHHKPTEIPEPASSTTVPPTGGGGSQNIIDSVCFDEQIRPILLSNCAISGCHDDADKQAGIDLYSYDSLKASVSGNLLLQVIQDTGPLRMPSGLPPLTSSQIQLIQKWVNEGMKDGIDCLGPCDSVNVTFSGTINPIIQNNCVGCHTGTSPDLTTYANIKVVVDNGKLSCSINHLNGCVPMPENGPMLSQCKLAQIKKWIDSGAPNN